MDLTILTPYAPIIIALLAIIAVLTVAHKAKSVNFSIFDYFIDPATNKASITKTLQVSAGVTATWVVVKMTASGTLTAEMFGIYLAALGISEGWSKYVGAKYINGNQNSGN